MMMTEKQPASELLLISGILQIMGNTQRNTSIMHQSMPYTSVESFNVTYIRHTLSSVNCPARSALVFSSPDPGFS